MNDKKTLDNLIDMSKSVYIGGFTKTSNDKKPSHNQAKKSKGACSHCHSTNVKNDLYICTGCNYQYILPLDYCLNCNQNRFKIVRHCYECSKLYML